LKRLKKLLATISKTFPTRSELSPTSGTATEQNKNATNDV
jgi:hypothetical protein